MIIARGGFRKRVDLATLPLSAYYIVRMNSGDTLILLLLLLLTLERMC